MDQDDFKASDVEDFAEYLGLDGQDADLFYESYYQIHDGDKWLEELQSLC